MVSLLLAANALATVPFESPPGAVRELVNHRTPESRTWELQSGQRLTLVVPAEVPPSGLTLDREGNFWTARADKADVRIPAHVGGPDGGLVGLTTPGGARIEFGLQGGVASAEAQNGVVTYKDILSGVDVRLRTIPTGLKEDVILSDRGSAGAELTYDLDLSNHLTIRGDGAGGLVISKMDKEIFFIPAPTLVDAGGIAGPTGRFEARALGDGAWEVTTELNQNWLLAPERAWPVVVDPTINVYSATATYDCNRQMRSTASNVTGPFYTCNSGSERRVGQSYSADGKTYYHNDWLMRFNTLTPDQTEFIDSATLKLHRLSSISSPPSLKVERIVPEWTAAAPPTGLTPSWYDLAPYGQISPGANGQVSVDISGLAYQWRRWYQSSQWEGYPNNGILIQQTTPPNPSSEGKSISGLSTQSTNFASTQHPESSKRPVLEVKSWPSAPAGSAVISPFEGDLTAKRVTLQAVAQRSSVTSVRFQYIAGSQRTWTDIPLAALRNKSTRAALTSQDIPVISENRSQPVVWDLTAMTGGEVDGDVHVRAWLNSPVPADGGMTPEVGFRLDRRGIDGAPQAPIGPGEVDLNSGEFTLDAVDASFAGFLEDLVLNRTYQSRGAGVRKTDMFGSGWTANVNPDGGELPYTSIYSYSELKGETVDRQVLDPANWNWEEYEKTKDFEDLEAEIETAQEKEVWRYDYAIIELSDGGKLTFTQKIDPEGTSSGWEPDDEHPGYSLVKTNGAPAGYYVFTLTDPDKNVATFKSESKSSPCYRLTSFRQPGSTSEVSYAYENAGTRQRLKSVTAPNPVGGIERSMQFVWGSVGTPPVSRVTQVQVKNGPDVIPVASYSYDANGRLTKVTDPRATKHFVEYSYDTGGRLSKVAPAGRTAWELFYKQVPGDGDWRLSSVKWGTKSSTVLYGVPLEGSGAPYDMSTTQTAKWAQDDIPWDAVAVFPFDDTPPSESNPDYSKATIHYLNVNGKTVNIAEPGGAIATAEYDAHGNIIRSLSPANRAAALEAGASSVSVAQARSSYFGYSPDGVVQVRAEAPQTTIKLPTGSTVAGRRVSVTNYDEGAPEGTAPQLPTSEFLRIRDAEGNYVYTHKTAEYSYGAFGGMSGWTARHATRTVMDPEGKALTSFSVLHPTYPIVEITSAPGGGADIEEPRTTPDVQYYQYYGVTPSSKVPTAIKYSGCTGQGTYASGELCLRSEKKTPEAEVPRRLYTYNFYRQPTRVLEDKAMTLTEASAERVRQYQYNATGDVTVEETQGAGTQTPAIVHTYNPATGDEIETTTVIGIEVQSKITRAYDSFGRLQKYTDAAGTVTEFGYDDRNLLVSETENGSRVTSYAYDDRFNMTSIDDADLEPITASYDADGRLLTKNVPWGQMVTKYDPDGSAKELYWVKNGVKLAKDEVLSRDVDGNIVSRQSGNTREEFVYDSVGRLTTADAVRLADNRCVRKQYVYDQGVAGDSDRTGATTWTGSPGKACGTGTQSSRAYNVDSASRIIDTGWEWDMLDRATKAPAPDSGGAGAASFSYYSNDMARSITLDGRTQTFTRDGTLRVTSLSSSGASLPTITSTYRYSGDGDRPTSIARSDGSTERFVTAPDGTLTGIVKNGEVSYQLRDLQGSIIATADASGNLLKTSAYDPFGAVSSPAPNVIDWENGVPGYGWMGGFQRASDFGQTSEGSAGPIEMGARVYLPAVGKFTSTDPVDGGSASAYDYGYQNPIGNKDLSGKIAFAEKPGFCVPRTSIFKKTFYYQFRWCYPMLFVRMDNVAELDYIKLIGFTRCLGTIRAPYLNYARLGSPGNLTVPARLLAWCGRRGHGWDFLNLHWYEQHLEPWQIVETPFS